MYARRRITALTREPVSDVSPSIAKHRNAQADVVANASNANGAGAKSVIFGSGVNFGSAPRTDGLIRRRATSPMPALRADDHVGAARAGGFSWHAGIDIAPGERAALERLCR